MDDVLVGGIDALEEFLTAIVDGPNAAVSIAIHGEWLGGFGVVRAFDAANGIALNPTERMMYHRLHHARHQGVRRGVHRSRLQGRRVAVRLRRHVAVPER
jgi:ABC-type sugar transport system substrate-binding protein